MTTHLFFDSGEDITSATVTAVGQTYDDIEPFVRYAVENNLPASVGSERSLDRRAVGGTGDYPSVTVELRSRTNRTVDVATFLLSLIAIKDPDSLEKVFAVARQSAEAAVRSFPRVN